MRITRLKSLSVLFLGLCSALTTNAQTMVTADKVTDTNGKAIVNNDYYMIRNCVDKSYSHCMYRNSGANPTIGATTQAASKVSIIDSTYIWKFTFQSSNSNDIQIYSPDETRFLTWRNKFKEAKYTIGVASVGHSDKPKDWKLYQKSSGVFGLKLDDKLFFAQQGYITNIDCGLTEDMSGTFHTTYLQFTHVYRVDFVSYTVGGIKLPASLNFIGRYSSTNTNSLFVQSGNTDIKGITFVNPSLSTSTTVSNTNVSYNITYADGTKATATGNTELANLVKATTQNMSVEVVLPNAKAPYTITQNYLDENGNKIAEPSVGYTYTSYTLPTAPTVDGYTLATTPSITNPVTADVSVNCTYNTLPFKISGSISTTFPDETHWYRLTLGGNYWVYDASSKNVKAATKSFDFPFGFTDDNALWCITGNETTGYKIYNKAAGTNCVLVPSNNASDVTTPLTVGAATDNTWFFKKTSNNWNVIEKNKTSNFIYNKSNLVAIKTNASAGSDAASAVTFTNIQDLAKSVMPHLEGVVFGYTSADMAEYKAAANTENCTLKTMIEAINTLKTKPTIQFSTNKFYVIQNATDTTLYASSSKSSVTGGTAATESIEYDENKIPLTTWHFVPVPGEDGQYYLSSNGYYFGKIGYLKGEALTKDADEAGIYAIKPLNFSQAGIKCLNNVGTNPEYKYLGILSRQQYGRQAQTAANDYSFWYIKEVNYTSTPTTEAIKKQSVVSNITTSFPYASRCLPINSIVPENTTAYSGTIDYQRYKIKFHTYATAGQIIKANTPVILLANNLKEGFATTLMLEPTMDEGEATPESNDLKGTPLEGTTRASIEAEGNNAYVLAAKGTPEVVGFYKFIGTTIPGYRAYFTLSQSQKASAFSFDFNDAVSTAIEELIDTQNKNNNNIFDLSGRRATNPTKGIYIQNRKLIIK